MEDYKVLIGKHEGEDAIVVGAGTSLQGVDLSPIHDHVVLSVNSGFVLMPWQEGDPDKRYWISNDALVRRWSYWKDVKSSNAIKIVRDSWEPYYDEIPDFLVFWPRPTDEATIDPDDDGLCYCSSVPTSIDLAIQMGCKRIFVLGVDQYQIGNRRYFWQFWPMKEQPRMFIKGMSVGGEYLPNLNQQRWTFGFDRQSYKALAGFAELRGVEVYNCNPASRVDSFPKIPLDKAFELLNGA